VVTGGAGFIGRNVVAELNRRGEERVLIVDRLGSDERWKNLRGLQFEDLWTIEPLPRGVPLGRVAAGEDGLPSRGLQQHHRDGCGLSAGQQLPLYARAVRMVPGAGGAVCVCLERGDVWRRGQGYSDADEATPGLAPLNMYGMSKHLFDLWALRSGRAGADRGAEVFQCLRPGRGPQGRHALGGPQGPWADPGNGGGALFKSYKPEYGDGEQVRDFVYVQDAVAVTLFCGENERASGLFNCGTGQARSWNDLAKAVFAAMGREPQIEYIDMPETLRDKYQYFTEAQMGKLRAAGYDQPFTSLEDGIRDYVQGHLARI
jgi:ADP-L-glycero-D-manno-heptose 6-epimerase